MKHLLNTPIEQIEFAAVDLETTGFSSSYDRVIEIAAVKIKNNKIDQKFQSLIFTNYIPYQATRIHGIDVDMLEGAPNLDEVKFKFQKFVRGCVLIGHNIKSFDMPFLRNFFEVSDSACVDTLRISRMLFSFKKSHKLSSVAERMGIKSRSYHRAMNDALATARVFLKFLSVEKDRLKILKDIIA